MSRGFPGSLKPLAAGDTVQVSLKKSPQVHTPSSTLSSLPLLVCSTSDHSGGSSSSTATFMEGPTTPSSRTRGSSMFATVELGLQALWPQMEEIREELMIDSPSAVPPLLTTEGWEDAFSKVRQFKVKVKNPSLRRLLSGAFAGAVSRTAVAPLETIRTHLMVGDAGKSVTGVFLHIMQNEGWQGLFRGNGINVIRVTPSKAIELFAYDTVKKALEPRAGETPRLQFPLPVPTIAGAAAGVCSTVLTYPLELLKTRHTIQRGVYDNLIHAFVKIVREEGPLELYRGLAPSVIGIIPYCGINYLAYEMLKKGYKRLSKQERVGHLATLLVGSAAGVISSSATFPLEVARKQMQMGALNGRQVYRHVFHALQVIMEQQGVGGLYRGLGASCIKLVPAAGISFMCYEACKQILAEEAS